MIFTHASHIPRQYFVSLAVFGEMPSVLALFTSSSLFKGAKMRFFFVRSSTKAIGGGLGTADEVLGST